MPSARVLVVDDSAAMRALFCDILDNAKGVDVCGVASSADEAREKIDKLRPDVLTLDVEMPGKSGMEFLEELMADKPMPVIMLSSITQAGTGTAKRALELGAVHCFPKPLHSSREEFDATVAKLGGIVIQAAAGELLPGGGGAGAEDADADADAEYEPSDRIVAMACGQAGIETGKRLLAAYPANCPPTILVIDAEPAQVETALASVKSSVACEVEYAVDGMPLRAGRAYIAHDRSRHVIIEAGSPPLLRLVERDAVAGFRPSADLLFGSIARAGQSAIGGLLVGSGTDGAKGLQILASASMPVFAQSPASYAPRERYDAVGALGIEFAELGQDEIGAWLFDKTKAVPA